ncbi:MAG: DUF2130 domain-containing protein [Candidatus Levyibacteriota bacterium]
MQSITCPHCKKVIEITQALTEEVMSDISEKHKEELQKVRLEEKVLVEKKIREELDMKLKEVEQEKKSDKQRIEKLMQDILKANDDMRILRQKDEEREIENQKKLALEREKMKEELEKVVDEKAKLIIAEKDKQLEDTKKALEEATRKAEQKSQQLQGESFELGFEELLTRQYPHDKFIPVKKGVRGGDIIQEVWDANGNFVGKVLWELKNTKSWSEQWIDKLKGDRRESNVDEAILVSDIIPADMKHAGFRNGVWVSRPAFIIPLTDSIRAKLIQLFYIKKSAEGKDMKMEVLYKYLTGSEFQHRIEGIIDAFNNLLTEIEKEKRYFTSKWARDEKNIRQIIDNTYGMHGDLKGIVGGALQTIKDLEMIELTDGK